jgi:hypothetical protein
MIQYFDEAEQRVEEKKEINNLNMAQLDKLAYVINLVNSEQSKGVKDILELSKIETLRKEDLEKLSYIIAFNSPVHIEIDELINLALHNLPHNIFEVSTKFEDYITPLLAVSELYLKKIEYFLNIAIKNPISYKTKCYQKIKEILSTLNIYNNQMQDLSKKINLKYIPKSKNKSSKDSVAFYQKINNVYLEKIQEQINNNMAYQIFLTKKNYLIHSTIIRTYDYLKNSKNFHNENDLDGYLEDVDIEYKNLSNHSKHNLKLFLLTEQEFIVNDSILPRDKINNTNIIPFPKS